MCPFAKSLNGFRLPRQNASTLLVAQFCNDCELVSQACQCRRQKQSSDSFQRRSSIQKCTGFRATLDSPHPQYMVFKLLVDLALVNKPLQGAMSATGMSPVSEHLARAAKQSFAAKAQLKGHSKSLKYAASAFLIRKLKLCPPIHLVSVATLAVLQVHHFHRTHLQKKNATK